MVVLLYNRGMDRQLPRLKIQIIRHHQTTSGRHIRRKQQDSFRKLSVHIANRLGTSGAFYVAFFLILVWALSGPLFRFSDTWQLVINTGTTIVTFLMVFVIQNTQNRDSRALHLKLDELIKSQDGARVEFVDVEDLSDTELDELQEQFKDLHAEILKQDVKQ